MMIGSLRLRLLRCSLMSASVAAIAMAAAPASAQAQARAFDIPAQPLSSALLEFSRQSDVMVLVAPELTDGRRSQALRASLPANEAIARLLRGTGLRAVPNPRGGYRIERNGGQTAERTAPAEPSLRAGDGASAAADDEGAAITVTGSRIRGAQSASPLVTITAEEIRNAGQVDLGETIRALPQNFNGGQNPGVGSGGAEFLPNANAFGWGASGANLRGLGSSATLTLLNGRRLSYGGFQNAVDVSSVALPAVERIEVATDGASAIYGSDAIGGVVNIILRRNYDGASITGTLGASTDGGNTRYQVGGAVGRSWGNGSILVGGEFRRNTEIFAGQRSYAAGLFPTATIFPFQRDWSAVGSGHQEISTGITLSLDGLYGNRRTNLNRPLAPNVDSLTRGFFQPSSIESFLVSPDVEFQLGTRWRITAGGSYGSTSIAQQQIVFTDGVQTQLTANSNRNILRTVQVDAEGPIFRVSEESARLALGGGWREITLRRFNRVNQNPPVDTNWSQDSYFLYGEVFIPVATPGEAIPGVHRLGLSAALRHESYANLEEVTTPKLGLIYSPTADFTISGTWGRSFKAATLSELFGNSQTSLVLASTLGATGVPPTAQALFRAGSNPTLRPERSSNWTATLAIHPRSLGGARFEFSYFDIDYTDRIALPITTGTATALSNPANEPFIIRSPTAAQVNAAIAEANVPLFNPNNLTLNPANVVAIVDSRQTNVSIQRVRGLDFTARYSHDTGTAGSISGQLSLSYLKSQRQVVPSQPVFTISGTVYNPPSWRARGGLTWTNDELTISAFANYIGSLRDVRPTVTYTVGAETSVDLVARYRVNQNFEVQLSALNIFNAKPDPLQGINPINTPFDSTNYSAVGRFISGSVTARF